MPAKEFTILPASSIVLNVKESPDTSANLRFRLFGFDYVFYTPVFVGMGKHDKFSHPFKKKPNSLDLCAIPVRHVGDTIKAQGRSPGSTVRAAEIVKLFGEALRAQEY